MWLLPKPAKQDETKHPGNVLNDNVVDCLDLLLPFLYCWIMATVLVQLSVFLFFGTGRLDGGRRAKKGGQKLNVSD